MSKLKIGSILNCNNNGAGGIFVGGNSTVVIDGVLNCNDNGGDGIIIEKGSTVQIAHIESMCGNTGNGITNKGDLTIDLINKINNNKGYAIADYEELYESARAAIINEKQINDNDKEYALFLLNQVTRDLQEKTWINIYDKITSRFSNHITIVSAFIALKHVLGF